jgi:hypothetical protein
MVRLRVGLALAAARERESVPVLIDLLAVLPADEAAQVQSTLYQLAGDRPPEVPAAGGEPAGRKKCRDAWAAWWKEHGAAADLARITAVAPVLGYTLLVEANTNRVSEVERDGKVRWAIDNLQVPIDAVVLPGDRVLIAEANAHRVTERDFKGNILWQKEGLPGRPVSVQRLANGRTFIATDGQLLEVDRAGKQLFSIDLAPVGAAYKGRDGRITCLARNGQCVRLDAAGKEIKSFPSHRPPGWLGGLDLLPGGHALIAQTPQNKVVEVDADGRVVREFNVPQPQTATALPNGNVLVCSNQQRAFEVDRKGKVHWEKTGGMYFLARRR